MKTISLLFLLLAFAQASLAQLSGPLSGTLGPGLYHVIGMISVESRDTLRLLPGTTFMFDGGYPFQIYGTLLAEGTLTDSIIFTADTLTNPDRWRGLRFSGSGSSGSCFAYCLIQWGKQVGGNGGGIYCADSSPTFTNCTISGNSAVGGNGGGIYCGDSSPIFTNCTISGNSASYDGGGVCCGGYSSSTFENCTISNNSGGDGGGVSCEGYERSASFTNCEINGNSGGGVFCYYAQPTFVNCVFWGNTRAAVFCWGSAPSFFHCSLVGNGGGVFCANCSTPTLNSTIIAFSQGPGIYFTSYTSSSRIEYCDFFANSGGNFSYEGGDSSGPPGIGIVDTINANGDACDIYSNIFFNPHFVDFPSYDLHLTDSSRCLGAGDPENPPPADIEGNPRPNPADSRPDIGAYESELAAPPVGLCGELSGTLGPGTFHITCTISVNAGDTLRLMPGTVFSFEAAFPFEIAGTLFAEGAEGDSIIFTADLQGNPNRWRGLRFLGTESSNSCLAYCVIENGRASGSAPHDKGGGLYFEYSSPALTNCAIIGNLADDDGGGAYCIRSSPDFVHCAISDNIAAYYGNGGGVYCFDHSSACFTNCTISRNTGGNGGGVCCESSSPTFANCVATDNTATSEGGGLFCGYASSPTFMSCVFTGNTARYAGGGMYCENDSSSTFEDCTFTGNMGMWYGGGMSCSYSSSVFNRCTFTANWAGRDGGGVECLSSTSSIFTHCIVIGNSAGGNGGGVDCRSSTAPQFTRCTIVANSAGGDGGGMYCHTSSPILTSSIVAFSAGVGIYFSGSPHCDLTYCNIFGNSGGAFNGLGIPDSLGDIDTINANADSCDIYFNIFLDPMFTDTATGDYHLLVGSPCIDAGDPVLPFDPDSTIADIGAFYYHQSAAEPPAILLPTAYALHPNWPNPFNASTMIRYDVPQAGKVSLTIFNLLGQRVATLFDGRQLAGSYTVDWSASNLPSGLYFCRMESAGFAQTRKMLLVK